MSVFKVKLTNQFGGPIINPPLGAQLDARLTGQGNLDEVAQDTGVSIQRTAYVMGPNKINRQLVDGETFTDCNYWKRFCATPTGPLTADTAIVAIVTDDGSVYVDGQPSTFPRAYSVTVANGSVYADNTVDVLGDNGGPAIFTQITNSGSNAVLVKINGLANSAFSLAAGATQTFAVGDIQATSLAFQDTSGGTTVKLLLAINIICNS